MKNIAMGYSQRDIAPDYPVVTVGFGRRAFQAYYLYAEVPSRERALVIAAEAKQYCNIDGTAWLSEVRRLIQEGGRVHEGKTEVQYFTLGQSCLCGVPNEIMCELALRAAQLLHNDHFYLGGYTNGCTGYFPFRGIPPPV